MKENWKQVPPEQLKNESIKIFHSNKWICSDNDSVELTIDFEHKDLELQFLSGITGSSTIRIDDLDFRTFGKLIDWKNDDFETKCFKIAEFFCELFCLSVDDMKKNHLENTGIEKIIAAKFGNNHE